MSEIPRLLLACIVVGLLVSCTDDTEPESAESAFPSGSPLSLGAAPRLEVGVVSGDTVQEFDRVVTPFLLADGRLAVPLAGARVVRLFGPTGQYLATLGGPGDGPGEFESLGRAWPRGDTVEVYDGRHRRVTQFLPDGSFVLYPLERLQTAALAVPGYIDEGWVLMGIAGVGTDQREEMVLHRFARNGSPSGELLRAPGLAWHTSVTPSGPDPLSPRAVFGIGPGHFYVGDTSVAALDVYDSTGALARRISWEVTEAMSPDIALGMVRDSVLARASPERAPALLEYVNSFPARAAVPAYWSFIVDDLGFVWIRPYDVSVHAALSAAAALSGPGPGGRWAIYAPDGAPVGTVDIPADVEPAQITANALVGIRRDELGVESVRVFEVLRR